MFEPGLLAIATITVGNINADQRHHYGVQFSGLHQGTNVTRKSFVTSRATHGDAKKDFFADFHGPGADVICILHRVDQPATVESNVEFAGQVIERPVVEDDLSEFVAKR